MDASTAAEPHHPPQRGLPQRLNVVLWVLLILASLLVGRAIDSQNANLLDLRKYALLEEKSPFQERILMAPVLRAAGDSPRFLRLYHAAFDKTIPTPEDLAVSLVDCLCLLLLLPVTVALRRAFEPRPQTDWLAPLLTLLVVAFTYVVHYEQRFTMPYDMPSLLLFNLGLLAIVQESGWFFLLVLALAIPNRETAVFLAPVWFWLCWRRGHRSAALLYGVAGVAIALAWRVAIAHLLERTAAPYMFPWRTNLASILSPIHWPQVACALGFLAVPMWMLRGCVTDRRLRALWFALIPFFVSALIVGIWKETRIFGEISALAGLTFAVQLEQVLKPLPAGRLNAAATHRTAG